MSSPSRKASSVAKLNDALLGSFSCFSKSETLDHLLRYLGTWSGSDKLMMLVRFSAKLLIPILQLRARLLYRAGLRKTANSSAVGGLQSLIKVVGDARRLWGLWGILSVIQWLIALEKNPPPTRSLLTIERLQGWAMLAFYPLESLSYFVSHSILPPSLPSLRSLLCPLSSDKAKRVRIDEAALGLWSTRLWALYVGLQIVHLREDRKLLRARQRALKKAKSKGTSLNIEQEELKKKWDSHHNEWFVNLSYLPLTWHWSLEKGILPSETFVAFFGVCAAIGSIRAGWKATALPPTLPTREATEQGATVQVEVLAPLDQAADFSEDLATAPLTTDGFPNNVSRS